MCLFRIARLAALGLVIGTSSLLCGDEPRTATLVPGVSIHRLPVQLKNIDSVSYAPDGRLYAAGYDGRVFVLTDTNGDGLEDHAAVFWDQPGDLLTPVGMLATKEGVYVAARGKIALLTDTDGDGVADISETVVSGWPKEKFNGDTRNDAAGVAMDAAGNLYFSLGCMSFRDAYLLQGTQRPQYDIRNERGTILKVSPDRKHREIVATGLRFVIGLGFNGHGDLFATDQEGDTWFPGGNPRDELLHILPGRHFGFPFRHPQYLPDVVDEPEVVGFSPQHQSTCGFRFNETRPHQKPFGPSSWHGNAIVTGFSRGKLWRVPLTKTRAGYVGKQVQFAAFESLLTDVAISPDGDLLVTAHSGRPDWGAGPAADGFLYKLRYDVSAPQPIVAWSASPLEVKIAFDRPVNKQRLQRPQIEMGEFVWEGDRYEWITPGYEVVEAAKRAPRRPLNVGATTVSEDGRTVTFTTAGQPLRTRYGITLPGVAAADSTNDSTIELSFDHGGAWGRWAPTGVDQPSWTGWLPHVDTNVITTLTEGSAHHDRLRTLWQTPGQLVLRSQLRLPGNRVRFRLESNASFEVRCGDHIVQSQTSAGKNIAQWTSTASQPAVDSEPRGGRQQVLPSDELPLEVIVQTGRTKTAEGLSESLILDASYQADFDPYERPLRLEHVSVPWTPSLAPSSGENPQDVTTALVAGNPVKGRELFYGKETNCAACHAVGGRGGTIAADLTVAVHRSTSAVLRDIVEPNAAINPDYVSYTVLTDSGKALTGLLQSADARQVTLVDAKAQTHHILRNEIETIQASPVSLMPTGFDKLGPEKLQDLVAFLCSEDMEAKRKGLPTGVIQRDYWLPLEDGPVSTLTKSKTFPDSPTGTGLLTRFEAPVNWRDHFGARISGYVHPPQTGEYVFSMAADDHAELWLSTSTDPKKKVRLVKMDRWTPSRAWEKYPEQQSKPIRLEAGKRYYIEALQTEQTVDDCLAVGWKLPDGTVERPIPGKRLSTASP